MKATARAKPRGAQQLNVQSAREAGLIYVSDRAPGIKRVRRGRGFHYMDPRGRRLKRRADLDRIARLAIPPAWTDVWICTNPRGHLQACGRDARGRKQYRYHTGWRQSRDEAKYDQMLSFAMALPALRRQIAKDLSAPGLSRRKVIAAVVQLLEKTLIRVGNDEYARENNSYGLTTMRNRHVRVSKSTLHFRFKGKAGKFHDIAFSDARLARIVRRCQDLPGHELFGYVDDNGDVQDIGSADVNEYLREVTGQDFTAKSFRTWAATVLASGPRAGLAEINLPAMQPGSSIMPGKVNPVMPELVNLVAFKVIGNDVTVSLAAHSGQLQLNAYEPVEGVSMMESQHLLYTTSGAFRTKCVQGITLNEKVLAHYMETTVGIVTALNPVIGYEKATELAGEAYKSGKGILEIIREKHILTEAQIKDLLDPVKLTNLKRSQYAH